MKRESYSVGSVSGLLGLALAGVACSEPGPTSSAGTPSSTASANGGASGDSVGAPECDEVLKKAASCKDKPGMGPILANRDQWKSGLSNASTKDATIAGCKAAMETVNAVGCDGGGVMTGTAPASSGSAGAGSSAGDSVGAPECDEVLKKAASCKDKPGMSAILSNRDNWKRGLGNTATKDATITACKAAMEGVNAVGCDAGSGATGTSGTAWDGKAAYTCTGNDAATITGVTANIVSGPAVTANGNCKLTLKDCTITSNEGISANGNAQVTVEGGEIKASDTAIAANGNAQVTVNGGKVSGKVVANGNAKVTGVTTAK